MTSAGYSKYLMQSLAMVHLNRDVVALGARGSAWTSRELQGDCGSDALLRSDAYPYPSGTR